MKRIEKLKIIIEKLKESNDFPLLRFEHCLNTGHSMMDAVINVDGLITYPDRGYADSFLAEASAEVDGYIVRRLSMQFVIDNGGLYIFSFVLNGEYIDLNDQSPRANHIINQIDNLIDNMYNII